MSTLSNYLVTCLTEGQRIPTDYRYTAPTNCPNNNEHSIDVSQTVVLNTVSDNVVTINQGSNTVTTDGVFRVDSYTFTCPTGTSTHDIIYPYNTCLFSGIMRLTEDNIGDHVKITTKPDTIVGVLSSGISAGATGLSIGNVSILKVGILVSVTNGVTTDDLGEIVSINNLTNSIVFSNPSTHAFSAGAYVRITVELIRDMKICSAGDLELGQGRLKTLGMAANGITRVIYTNNGASTKEFNLIAQIYY